MGSQFGPPPLNKLTVSPVPGAFGQGFPGLLYISTLAYLEPKSGRRHESDNGVFFSELLHAHETAHQWWGNLVATASYRDDWLMEALANYSALLHHEKKRGSRALDTILENYRERLLEKTDDDRTIESAGPIVWSLRLQSSVNPRAWRLITYEKGSWIMHMLRRRLGDERFSRALGELARRHRFKTVSTDTFKALMEEHLPPNAPERNLQSFFDQWVYGTGIPSLKMSYTVRGKAPALRLTGTVVQAGVTDDFSVLVPIEIQIARSKSVTQWVRTNTGSTSFEVRLRQKPLKVTLNPGNAVLVQ
jgi:aminopeptidase N